MKTALFFASRYLFAKKKHHVINIISLISVTGVLVGTAGLIIVLSVFNGFSGLVMSLYDSFDPDLKVSPVAGKTMTLQEGYIENLRKIEGVKQVSLTLTENALVRYGERQYIAAIKGVDSNFTQVSAVGEHLVDGVMMLRDSTGPLAVVGSGVAWSLSLSLRDPYGLMSIYVPVKGGDLSPINPSESFRSAVIRPAGVFSIQQDFDSKYVIVPMEFAREITGDEKTISAVEIGLAEDANTVKVHQAVQSLGGSSVVVQTRMEQHDFLYKILRSEKWAIYLILSFILIIAIFNITGSLSMLIIDKKQDIFTLSALGASPSLIRMVFLFEGMLITLTGAVAGLFTGWLLCFIQLKTGFIKIDNSDSFLIDAYPVAMEAIDFVYTLGIVLLIGLLASGYASAKAVSEIKMSVHSA